MTASPISTHKIFERFERLSKDQVKNILLQISREKDILTGILDGIELVVLAFDPEGKVFYANRCSERFFKIKRRQIIERSILNLFSEPDVIEVLKKFLVGKEKIQGVEIFIDKKKIQIGRVHIFPLTEKGIITAYVFLLEDVTEGKTIALKNLHQQSIRSLAALTAGVAHEIKNPLGALDLHIQLIQRFIHSHRIAKKNDLLELTTVVDEEIKRLDKIVNDFLFSVRPIKARPKPENINRILQELQKFLEPEMKEAGIIFETDLAEDIPIYPLDKNYIKQALINLIANAKNAMDPHKGKHRITLHSDWQNQKLIISVEDNGIGITPESQVKIFDPFYTSRERGTGLGLTIVYKIVSEHGGEIILSSQAGKGSTFRLELPLRSNQYLSLQDP